MSHTKKVSYVKQVICDVEISLEEAKNMITEAKIYSDPDGNYLDVYQNTRGGFINRVFTLNYNNDIHKIRDDEDALLEYARNHMPESIKFNY